METSKLFCGAGEDTKTSTTSCSKLSGLPPPRPNSSLFEKRRKMATYSDSRAEPDYLAANPKQSKLGTSIETSNGGVDFAKLRRYFDNQMLPEALDWLRKAAAADEF